MSISLDIDGCILLSAFRFRQPRGRWASALRKERLKGFSVKQVWVDDHGWPMHSLDLALPAQVQHKVPSQMPCFCSLRKSTSTCALCTTWQTKSVRAGWRLS